jgi:hypothetical protein
MKPLYALLVLHLLFVTVNAQNGPGGVGDTSGTSNLVLWLAADYGVIVDANQHVTQWTDHSGYGAHAFPYPSTSEGPLLASAPTYSLINFTPEQTLRLTDPFIDATRGTLFIVYKDQNTGTAISMNGVQGQKIQLDGRKLYRYGETSEYAYTNHQCYLNVPTTQPRIIGSTWYTSMLDFEMYQNGVISKASKHVIGDNQPFFTLSDVYIGNNDHFSWPPAEFRGKIMEVIVYNDWISGEDQLKVNSYLACKYGIDYTYCTDFEPCEEKFSSYESTDELMSLFPVPATENISIAFDETLLGQQAVLTIYDVMGQVIYSESIFIRKICEK